MHRLLATVLIALGVLFSSGAYASNQAVVHAVNAIRAAHGVPPLKLHPQLQAATNQQSVVMAKTGKMAHTAARGYDFSSRLKMVGYRGAAAENIARGQKSLRSVLSGWMNSRGHRRNMLNPRMRYFGLAVVQGKGRNYWAMVLGAN